MGEVANDLKNMFQLDTEKEDMILQAIKLMTTRDKDLALKTEINEPLSFSAMYSFAQHLKIRGMIKSANFLKTMLDNYQVFVVSKNRKSRQEVIELVKELQKRKEDNWDKFFHGQGGSPSVG